MVFRWDLQEKTREKFEANMIDRYEALVRPGRCFRVQVRNLLQEFYRGLVSPMSEPKPAGGLQRASELFTRPEQKMIVASP